MALNPQALNPRTVLSSMLAAATSTAGAQWQQIRSIATQEIQNIASRLAAIATAVANRSLTPNSARTLMAMIKNHAIATIAMLTTLVVTAVQRIINAALRAVRQAVNTAVGFALL